MTATTTRETCPRCGTELAAGCTPDLDRPCPGESPAQTVFWTAWFAGCLADVETVEGDSLIVNHKHGLAEAVDNALPAEGAFVTLTGDGRHVDTYNWCTCTSEGEWVRYERYTAAGREAHGYACQACRRITQTG